jgi:hypothetical protein
MAFTAGELTNIANAALDFYLNRGKAFDQAIQRKPMIRIMEANAKTFPGGKGDISIAVVGKYGAAGVNDGLKGYTHNDTVNFYTPANIQRANYTWREHHIGLTLTMTELKIDGLSVVDSTSGLETKSHSKRDETVLVNLLDNKLADFAERYAVTLNDLLWGDGLGDAKALAGIRALVTANPGTGIVGGIDRSVVANRYWMNRARTAAFATAIGGDATLGAFGGGPVTSNVADGGALLQVLQAEKRQLMRYGGEPNTMLCGSDFLAAMEKEIRANGSYSQTGFRGGQDGAMGKMTFDGTEVQYDPTLDNLSLSKRCYWFSNKDIFLEKMDQEWKRQHDPARPYNQFVVYRSVTSTGQLVATRLNSALVIDIV